MIQIKPAGVDAGLELMLCVSIGAAKISQLVENNNDELGTQ